MGEIGDTLGQQSTHDGALARWVTWKDTVALKRGRDEWLIPTPSEILAADRKGVREIRGIRFMNSPSKELPSIKFSRFPASLRLVVTVPGEGNGFRGRWRLEASGDSGTAPAGESGLSVGHLLCGECWHSLVQEEVDEVFSLMRACGLREGETLSLGAYLKLVECRERGLVDCECTPHPFEI